MIYSHTDTSKLDIDTRRTGLIKDSLIEHQFILLYQNLYFCIVIHWRLAYKYNHWLVNFSLKFWEEETIDLKSKVTYIFSFYLNVLLQLGKSRQACSTSRKFCYMVVVSRL